MAPMTVTATQGGSTANGLILRLYVLTGALPVASQTGGTASLFTASTTVASATGTIQQASSRVYGAIIGAGGQAFTTGVGAGSTLVDTPVGNGDSYGTFKNLTPATGSQNYGLNCAANQNSGVTWLEVLAAATLAEDASAPALANASSAAVTTVTTASFTPPAGSLLVALVASDGGAAVTTMTVTDNLGTHLNWTQKVVQNPTGGDYAGVWIADVPAAGAAGLLPQQERRRSPLYVPPRHHSLPAYVR